MEQRKEKAGERQVVIVMATTTLAKALEALGPKFSAESTVTH